MNEAAGGGEKKIDAAKKAFRETMEIISPATNVGLMVFGQTRPGDHCDDITLLYGLGEKKAAELVDSIDRYKAQGGTPIADSLLRAKGIFANQKGANNSIILITDGREECKSHEYLCKAADELAALGVELKVHIVGLGHKEGDRKEVECVANNTGGQYVAATDAKTLKEAIEIVTKPPTPVPPPVPEAQDIPIPTVTPPPPRKEARCKSGSKLPIEVCILGFSNRGRSSIISLSITNNSSEQVNPGFDDPSGANVGGGDFLTDPTGKKYLRVHDWYADRLAGKTAPYARFDLLDPPVAVDGKFSYSANLVMQFFGTEKFDFLEFTQDDMINKDFSPCRKSQFLEICITGIADRGTSVFLSWSVRNLFDKEIEFAGFKNDPAILVDATGQRSHEPKAGVLSVGPQSDWFKNWAALSGSGRLALGATAQLSADFFFEQKVSGNRFDFIYALSNPYSQFAFFNLRPK